MFTFRSRELDLWVANISLKLTFSLSLFSLRITTMDLFKSIGEYRMSKLEISMLKQQLFPLEQIPLNQRSAEVKAKIAALRDRIFPLTVIVSELEKQRTAEAQIRVSEAQVQARAQGFSSPSPSSSSSSSSLKSS
jgi:hypothetical protein